MFSKIEWIKINKKQILNYSDVSMISSSSFWDKKKLMLSSSDWIPDFSIFEDSSFSSSTESKEALDNSSFCFLCGIVKANVGFLLFVCFSLSSSCSFPDEFKWFPSSSGSIVIGIMSSEMSVFGTSTLSLCNSLILFSAKRISQNYMIIP